MNKEHAFEVGNGLTLTLEDIYAKVRVGVGRDNAVTVSVKGDEKVLNGIKVEQQNTTHVTIRGEQGSGNTIIASGGGSVSIGGNIHGGTIVTGRGSVVIVNGRVISGSPDGVTVVQGEEMPEITILVPHGTNLKSYNTEELTADNLEGRCDLTLSGQNKAEVSGAKSSKIKCSGQSRCRATNVKGDVSAKTSGQASIVIAGTVENVSVESSGQSHIVFYGDCNDFEGEASGQSHVEVSGRASGRIHKHSSGQSSISVR